MYGVRGDAAVGINFPLQHGSNVLVCVIPGLEEDFAAIRCGGGEFDEIKRIIALCHYIPAIRYSDSIYGGVRSLADDDVIHQPNLEIG